MNRKEIKTEIKKVMSDKKYQHSLRVEACALRLAKKYKLNEKKVSKAALLHDIGYFVGAKSNNIDLSHARRSVDWCTEHGIDSKKILNAILYHTTGNENMDIYAKVLFVADKIEPGRDYKGVDAIRKMAYKDIDKAILMIIENTEKYLQGNNKKIHVDTVKLYRKLILNG